MKVFLGIDLGSTTSKAVFINERGTIIGRGITNTRSNYEVAADIARMEAEFNSRFTLLHRQLKTTKNGKVSPDQLLQQLEYRFQYLQFSRRFETLMEVMDQNARDMKPAPLRKKIRLILKKLSEEIRSEIKGRFLNGQVTSTSEFFRDLFSGVYLRWIQEEDKALFDQLVALYDRSITPVENQVIEFEFQELTEAAFRLLPEEFLNQEARLLKAIEAVSKMSLEPDDYIGTGYGRQLLPFEEKHIKSEILCHAMGAHATFPATRTVLDIGGQDTKAIQVDGQGLVTSFQMNDRCAAGCGRYLGYIADEMNVSVSEIGPMALQATYEANICSTCTVFAGAELREYLNLGEKKENILAGLHQAIVQRAFALLARSGGVRNEFTFTGGVARNPAVIKYVSRLINQNYGQQIKINIHHDSIFMGALGAALFSAFRK
jgi:benzoyl-CoA reductase subunit A